MGKFDKYFITQTKPSQTLEEYGQDYESTNVEYPVNIDSEADGKVPGAFYFSPHIVVRPTAKNAKSMKPHCHDFDEYMLFMSFDPTNPADLGGEVEFWIEDEPHRFSKTTAIFIPRFTWHSPLIMRRVDRPFGFVIAGNTLRSAHLQFSPDPKYADAVAFDNIAEVSLGGKKYQVTKSYLEYLQWMMEKGRKNLPK